MSEEDSKSADAARIRSEAERAGISVSEEHALLAADWRGAYEDAVAEVRAMDYSRYEPSAIFIPVTHTSTPLDPVL